MEKDGRIAFEKLFDAVIDCMVLTRSILLYQEDYSSNVVSYLNLLEFDEEDEMLHVKHFKLPGDLVINDLVSASLEPFVRAHPEQDKQALRNLISSDYPIK